MIAFLDILLLTLQASRMAFKLAVTALASIEAISTVLLKGHALLATLHENAQFAIHVFFINTSVSGHIGSHLTISVWEIKSNGRGCL